MHSDVSICLDTNSNSNANANVASGSLDWPIGVNVSEIAMGQTVTFTLLPIFRAKKTCRKPHSHASYQIY